MESSADTDQCTLPDAIKGAMQDVGHMPYLPGAKTFHARRHLCTDACPVACPTASMRHLQSCFAGIGLDFRPNWCDYRQCHFLTLYPLLNAAAGSSRLHEELGAKLLQPKYALL